MHPWSVAALAIAAGSCWAPPPEVHTPTAAAGFGPRRRIRLNFAAKDAAFAKRLARRRAANRRARLARRRNR